MWFATKDGLNKYDGYSFTVFTHDPDDTNSISGNYIKSVFEDSQGRIWVGTLNGKIDIYLHERRKFTHIDLSKISSKASSIEISSIVEDADSNIWIGTRGNGLFRIKLDRNKSFSYSYKQFLNEPGAALSLSSNNITSLFVDSNGALWIGTVEKLDRFNYKEENFTRYLILTKNNDAPSALLENGITAIYESNNGQFWLGTLSGLVLFNRQSGKYTLYPHHYNIYRFGWGIINGIIEDNYGTLWLATAAELMRFNPENKSYDYIRNNPFDPNSISYNIISSICRDRTGILWVGTSGGGINIYDPKANRFSTLVRKKDASSRITGFSIRSILEDNSGYIWVSTDVLYRWDRNSGELKSFETSSNSLYDFGNTGAWSMLQSSSGKIWFATSQGLYCYLPSTGNIKHFEYNPTDHSGLPQKEVYTVFEDIEGNIWIITETFFSKITDFENGYFTNYQYVESLLINEVVRPVIYQDGNKNFWIGTKTGLLKFDETTGRFTNYVNDPGNPHSLNNNLIKSISPDPFEPDNILWIGTAGGGLNSFNISENIFSHFTEDDGLPNNVVYGILPDESGNLWLSTNRGLSRFNIQSKSFRNFDVSDGLQSNEFNTGAYFVSNSGEMFFGGIKGLNYFYPETIIDNPFIPEIVITGFKVLNHSGNRNEEKLVNKPISETDHIMLSYDDDFIQFEFASLDYSAPEKNQYAYKLDNFNEDWVYSGSVRSATYTNLSPGEYIFRVKGSNNDGIWNDKGAIIRLTITPPWWSTWWAYTMYAFLLLTVLYLIRRYELNRIFLKNQLKLEKVESDTLRNLDHMKSRFFANISHEFRTPLTLILGQIDNVMSSGIQSKMKGKLQVAARNSRRLLTLINQLLDLSKLEAGSMELKAECQNIVSFLKNLFYSFESLAESNKVALKFYSNTERILINFDPDKLEKVFYNLISNALKFTPRQGEVMVRIESKATEVEIIIKDTGIGISPDKIDHIFNRFYQVDISNTREHEGTGIGLALTKELVELHNGSIKVKSNTGDGSEFIIVLPMYNDEDPGYQKIPADREDYSFNSHKRDFERIESAGYPADNLDELNNDEIILIVEDNPDVRNYICEQLEKKYKIIEAQNGEQGLKRALDEIPDLIITDIMMPVMDGYQLSKAIRCDEKTSHIPIIMLTAKASVDDKIEGLETGIDAYVTKPFNSKELIVRVGNLINQRNELRKRFSGKTIIKPSDVTAISIDRSFLEKVISVVEANIENDSFSVDKLADEVNMSVSQLNRKLGALIDQPAGQLIRSMRLHRAADLLMKNAGTIAEICYKTGFNDQAYFSRAFKKQFGSTPSKFKEH